jgi:hypothetical protein
MIKIFPDKTAPRKVCIKPFFILLNLLITCLILKIQDFEISKYICMYQRGISGRWADPCFGRREGADGQWQCTALLLAHPVLGYYLRPCII